MASHMLNEVNELIGTLKYGTMLARSAPPLLGPRPEFTVGYTAYREIGDVYTILLPDRVEHLRRLISTFAQVPLELTVVRRGRVASAARCAQDGGADSVRGPARAAPLTSG
jgi:hypothetical protein